MTAYDDLRLTAKEVTQLAPQYVADAQHARWVKWAREKDARIAELETGVQEEAAAHQNTTDALQKRDRELAQANADIKRVTDDRNTVGDALEEMTMLRHIAALEATTYCLYCGEAFSIEDKEAAADAVDTHVKTVCTKHPMRMVEARNNELEDMLESTERERDTAQATVTQLRERFHTLNENATRVASTRGSGTPAYKLSCVLALVDAAALAASEASVGR